MASSRAKIVQTPQKTMLAVDPGRKVNDLLDRLMHEGWNVECVPDNQAALALMEAIPFDLVITGQKASWQDLLRRTPQNSASRSDDHPHRRRDA